MVNCLFVAPDKGAFSKLQSFLESGMDIQVFWAETGNTALRTILNEDIQVMILDETFVDMTGLELVQKVVVVNPTITCAVVSSLSTDEFHQDSEGLGVLMQLSPEPGEHEGRELLKRLKQVVPALARSA